MEEFKLNSKTPNKSTQKENSLEKTPIKDGVDIIFEQQPALSDIGTKEEYLKYIKTIFPDSKVKDILYHGTSSKNIIDKFDFQKSNFANAVFFTKDYAFAKSFAFDDVRDGMVQEQVLNIQNPFDFSNDAHLEELRPILKELVEENYRSNNTGITFRNNLPSINIGDKVVENPSNNDFVEHYMWRLKNGSWRIIETDRVIDFISKKYDSILVNEKGIANVAVFKQDQIHVLGSDTDLHNFRKFIETDHIAQSGASTNTVL